MRRCIAIHATHEAAERVGNIGHLIAGWLSTPSWHKRFERTLLVGSYPFPSERNVIDDLDLRADRGWSVLYDSSSSGGANLRSRMIPYPLARGLSSVAAQFGVRLVYGERAVGPTQQVPVLLIGPSGLRRGELEDYRAGVRSKFGLDLAGYDDYPALTAGQDHRLAAVLDPDYERHALGAPTDEVVVRDARGLSWPGGAGWAHGRAVLPPIESLTSFGGCLANKYLLELQVHTFAAPALWAATRVLLSHWHGGAEDSYDPERVTVFAHDWMGVPFYWAMAADAHPAGQAVYVAHEAHLIRLLADGSLANRSAAIGGAMSPGGFDCATYPMLLEALQADQSLGDVMPQSHGFDDIFYHRINREAQHFDRVVAVGPWVADEMRFLLRPETDHSPAVAPVGLSTEAVGWREVEARRERVLAVASRYAGFEPDVIVTTLARPVPYKAPWRVMGLINRLAERLAARGQLKLACFWLAAPRPRPSQSQIDRWSRGFGWPLGHQSAPEGDLKGDEVLLWEYMNDFNESYRRRARIFYINQHGWNEGELGALSPGDATWRDFRIGTDLEVDLPVYEPFGYAALEPYPAGAICVLSDACGAARHLVEAGLGESLVVGKFINHGRDPRTIDSATRREIEAAAYDQIIERAFEMLGVNPQADRSELRRQRLDRAAGVLRDLSWETAVAESLLPAITGAKSLAWAAR